MKRGLKKKKASGRFNNINKLNKFNKILYILLALFLVLAVCACFFIITKITGNSIITGNAIWNRDTLLFRCYDYDIEYHDTLGPEFTSSYAQVKFLGIITTETKYDKKVGDTLSEAYCISPTRNTVSYKEGIDCGGKFKRGDVNGNNEAWACCTSRCVGKICGSDGCEGGSCGTCTIGECNAAGTACLCTPDCTGKKCGSDGCEGSCGNCTFPNTCNANGVCVCIPSCEGKECGTAGCGSSENCGTLGGTCKTGECNKGVCPPAPEEGAGGIVVTSLDSSTSAQIPVSTQVIGPWELSASSRKVLTTTQNPAAFLNLTNGTYRVYVTPGERYAEYTNNNVRVVEGQTKSVTAMFDLLPNYVNLSFSSGMNDVFKVDRDTDYNCLWRDDCSPDCRITIGWQVPIGCIFDGIYRAGQEINFTTYTEDYPSSSTKFRYLERFTITVSPGDGVTGTGPRRIFLDFGDLNVVGDGSVSDVVSKSGGDVSNVSLCSGLVNRDDCINPLNWNDNILQNIELSYSGADVPGDFCTGEPYSEILINYPNCRQTLKCGCVWDVVGGCVGSVWPVYTNLTAGGCGV